MSRYHLKPSTLPLTNNICVQNLPLLLLIRWVFASNFGLVWLRLWFFSVPLGKCWNSTVDSQLLISTYFAIQQLISQSFVITWPMQLKKSHEPAHSSYTKILFDVSLTQQLLEDKSMTTLQASAFQLLKVAFCDTIVLLACTGLL